MGVKQAISTGQVKLSQIDGKPVLIYKGKHLPLTAKQIRELKNHSQ